MDSPLPRPGMEEFPILSPKKASLSNSPHKKFTKKAIFNDMRIFSGILLVLTLSTFALAGEADKNRVDSLAAKSSSIDSSEFYTPRKPTGKRLPVIIPFMEVVLQDAFVWSWDRFVLDKNYARIGPSVWKRNFREGWKWDDNHFAVNFFGHPYQGSHYYSAARASGYSFYESFFFAATGSYIWEMFCEQEYPAPNDFIATSIGGTIYGEILYRLSTRLLAKPDAGILENIGAFAMNPFAYIQEKINGASYTNPGYAPIELSVFAGVGKRFGNEYRYDEDADDRSDEDWNDAAGLYGLSLVYGRADRRIRQPFEYFTFDFNQEQSQDGMLMKLSAVGKLKNLNMHAGKNWIDLGTYLHFDTFYGNLVEMSALSIGFGADINLDLSEKIRFRMSHMPSYVILGSSNFNYDDILAAADSNYKATRDYQYSLGVSYKAMLELELKRWGRLYNKASVFLFRSIPNTEPHYGMKGYDFVAFNSANVEAYLPLDISLGIQLNSYLKIAAYERVQPMSQMMHSIGTYLSYRI